MNIKFIIIIIIILSIYLSIICYEEFSGSLTTIDNEALQNVSRLYAQGGNQTLNSLSTTGNVTIGGNVTASGKSITSGTITTTGNATIGGDIIATGKSITSGSLTTTGNSTIGGNLNVTGRGCKVSDFVDSGVDVEGCGLKARAVHFPNPGVYKLHLSTSNTTSTYRISGYYRMIDLTQSGTQPFMGVDILPEVIVGNTPVLLLDTTTYINMRGDSMKYYLRDSITNAKWIIEYFILTDKHFISIERIV